ncbi:MAG: alpha-amylase family glycosyl hydrolase [Prochlorotrichaceae cyanobacterium]
MHLRSPFGFLRSLLLSLIISLLIIFNPPSIATAEAEVLPTAGNLGNEVLYYIVVDRFLDGDPQNDIPEFAFPDSPDPDTNLYNQMNRVLIDHTYDPSHHYMGMYWGGDLEGVRQKLDYLKDLGVTKLILSPIQDNANGFFYHPNIESYLHAHKTDSGIDDFYRHISTAYHGYWTKDWFELEEHLRSEADGETDRYGSFRRLLNAAGERGIGIILDLTMNQTSPGHISTEPPAIGAGGSLFGESWFADNGDVYRHGQKVAVHWNPETEERDPQGWFHPPDIIWDFDTAPQQLIEEGQISGGMPDLDQSIPAVEQYFLDATRFWLTFNQEQYPIAGFRLDAVKHVNVSFWRKFEDLVLDLNPNAILIGEYFSGGYRNPASLEFLDKTKHISFFDFNFSEAARRFFAHDRSWDGRTYVLREITLGHQGQRHQDSPLAQLWHHFLNPADTLDVPPSALALIPDQEAKGWVTFIENHDQPRLKSYYPKMSDRAYASLIKFQFVAKGVPLLMYGTETGLAVPYHPDHEGLFGIGGDPFNRPMMIWSDAAGWKSEIYDATRNMAHLRQACPVLRYGDTEFINPDKGSWEDDIFMLRQSLEDQHEDCPRVLYAYSTHGGEFLLNFNDDRFQLNNYTSVDQGQTIAAIDGLLPIKLEPEEAKVFILR